MQQPQQQQHFQPTATTSGLSVAAGVTAAAEQSVTAAFVDGLKHQLLQAYNNDNTEEAMEVIIKLEKSNLTRELLEMTRIGAVVNDVRRKVGQTCPEFSKRCRALIKCWQKLAEVKPTSSGSSSANGTPNYASPAVRKGLTPGTPARGARVTPAGSSRLTPAANSRLTPLGSSHLTPVCSMGSRSSGTSPANIPNGRSVTPHQKPGPELPINSAESGSMRKSYTVGADLARKAVEDSLLPGGEIVRNGKRKAESIASSDAGITNGLGISITAAKRPLFNSTVSSPATPHQSLLAARRANVKSTCELVAQLTENLPGYLAINISKNQEGAEKGSVANANNKGQAYASTGHASTTPIVFTIQPEPTKKKEKRGRPKKDKKKDKESKKRDQAVTEEKVETVDGVRASTSASGELDVVKSSASSTIPSSTKEVVAPTRNGKYDWNAMLPTLETLRHRVQLRAKPSTDPRKSYIMNVQGREVLALPYVDIGMPDFLEYQFPDSGKFYAEENFIYGAPRPTLPSGTT